MHAQINCYNSAYHLNIGNCNALLLILFLLIQGFSTTYYVSNSGSNDNNGTSAASPFATLSYARNKLSSRDVLLLKRGDIFRDSLSLSSLSNCTIATYGPEELPKPVISGSILLSNWSRYRGNVYVSSCDKKLEKLFVNNTLMPLARYPDTGWIRIDTMTENDAGSNTVIYANALISKPNNASGYWKGSQIRWRRWSWWYETRKVSAYNQSGIITLEGKSSIHIMDTKGWGFFFDNKLEELDAPGEWFYDSSAKKVYLYPPKNSDLQSAVIEGSYSSRGIEISGGTVKGICLRHQLQYGISTTGKSTISQCRFEGIGYDQSGAALRAVYDIADSHIFGNVFENNLNIGISWYENSGRKGMSIIEYDTLINTGTFPGYGGSGTWHAVGILVHLSSNVRVQYNYLNKTGYAAVLLGSDSNFVQYNVIKNAMWTLNDGAAIYTDCSKSFIRNNIIYDTKGDLSSCGPWYPLSHGIWLEFLGGYRQSVIENNTVVRSGCHGIFLPNNFECIIKNNVLFDNASAQLNIEGSIGYSQRMNNSGSSQNNQFSKNVFYANSPKQMVLLYRPEYNYGSMSGNYFCNPFSETVVSGYGTGNKKWTISPYTLAEWSTFFPWTDKNGKTDPFKRPANLPQNNSYGKPLLLVNETQEKKEIPLGNHVYVDLDGNPVVGSLSIDPFSSKIVIQADSAVSIKQQFNQNNLPLITQSWNMFKFQIFTFCHVRFDVYTLLGRCVYQMPLKSYSPGIYSIALSTSSGDHTGLTTGMYTYVFTQFKDQRIVPLQTNPVVKKGKVLITH